MGIRHSHRVVLRQAIVTSANALKGVPLLARLQRGLERTFAGAVSANLYLSAGGNARAYPLTRTRLRDGALAHFVHRAC